MLSVGDMPEHKCISGKAKMREMMCLALFALLTLTPLAAVNAAVGHRYKCIVDHFEKLTFYGRREDPFKAARINYEITILKNFIQVVFEENKQKIIQEYPIMGETKGEIVGGKVDDESIDGISVSKWP